jgi:PAS domain S-box-containing protein
MQTRNFRNLLRRTLFLPLIFLVFLAVTLVVEVLSLSSNLSWVDHSDHVIDNSRQAMRLMVEMESSLRGYELTRDPKFLESFRQAKAQLPDQINRLEQLTADNQLQQNRLKEIADLDSVWIDWAEEEIARHAKLPPSDDELLYGVRLIDEIRSRQREVTAEEERLLHQRSQRASMLSRIVLISAVGLILLVGILLLTVTRKELRALTNSYEQHLRAEAEQTRQLQESREFFRITLNSLADGVVTTDAQEQVTFINPVGLKLTGWQNAAEVRGRRLREVLRLFDENTRVEMRNPLESLRRADEEIKVPRELLMLDRKGEEFPVEMNAAPILNEASGLAGTMIVFRDISQRRQTEQTLRATERLNQAGRLSATIAHEIRNPLDTVTNLIYLLQHDSNSGTMARQYLEMASEELSRITQITGQLLTFHREARHPIEVSIPEVLESVLTVFAPQIRKGNITVGKRFETEAPIRGFPGELRQVFSNLVGNAIDAMPHGGRMILSVREGSRSDDPRRKGVRTTIIDNGQGIPVGVKRNLFAPFYTTKGEKGTGLGLWVSRGIVEKHEGTIHVISSVREGRSGTAFSVFLPFWQVEGKLDATRVAPGIHA